MINHDKSMIKHDKHMIETYILYNMMNHNEHLIKHHITLKRATVLQFLDVLTGHLARYSDSGLFGTYGVGQPEKVQGLTCRVYPPFLETSESNTPYHSKINDIHILSHIQHR